MRYQPFRIMKNILCVIWFLSVMKHVIPRTIVTFPCGHDLCVANVRYCNHHDSDDPQKWTCTPCEEERSRCPTLEVPPHCYGYCQNIETEEILSENQIQLNRLEKKLHDVTKQKSINLQWKASNESYEQILSTARENSDNQRLVIRALSIATTSAGVALIFFLVYCCICRRKSQAVGSVQSLSYSSVKGTEDTKPTEDLPITAEEQEPCEGTRRARAIMTSLTPADDNGPSKVTASGC